MNRALDLKNEAMPSEPQPYLRTAGSCVFNRSGTASTVEEERASNKKLNDRLYVLAV